MSIFNSDDSQRGARDGEMHAEAGRDKDYSGAGLSPKFAIYGNKAMESYIEAYNLAYNTVIARKVFKKD